MISVVIPTLNAEAGLARCFNALVPAAVLGLVREVIVVDGGSTDGTARVADAAGAQFLSAPPGRGVQLAAGARAARQPFLLFLHADTALATGWEPAVEQFLGGDLADQQAAYFTFALDDFAPAARRLEAMVRLRNAVLGLPYGDQGLLISRRLYDAVGGFAPIALMEDVDLARRLGAQRLVRLPARAVTSAARYRAQGYWSRSLRNLGLLALYLLGWPPARLARLYR